ncbi:micronuclear linker histone polyprotein [Periplaneta americana]|uniref:micronuclear linker histone polyprotein n=1 Tax=Periplaneta americana TaxID=6978 RepID=UPI0037E90652
MAQRTVTCKECGWSCKNCSDQTNLHLHVEIENLKQRLLEREHHIVNMETNFLTEAEKFPNGEFAALTEELLTWQEKYSRLYESHKRVQKVNQSLEDKLLKIVDKCETEKNSLTRDVTSLTQKLVEAKGKINRLQDENERYRNDVNLAIQLLQCKPANFVSHKFDMLPADLQQKVRTYVSSKRRPSDGNGNSTTNKQEPKTIKVPIPTFPPTAMVYSISKVPADKDEDSDEKSSSSKPPVDIVSAAIMAKVLEERERERLNTKHCDTCSCPRQAMVDCSTQVAPPLDQGLLCMRCGTSVRGDISLTDTSNRASQGLVRYVDVVATRNGDIASRNQKSDSIFSLGTTSNSQTSSCLNVSEPNSENIMKVSKQTFSDENSNKDSDSKLLSSSRKNDGSSNRSNKSSNKNSEICRQNGGTKSSNNCETTKSGKSFVRSAEVSKPNDTLKQESDADSRQSPPGDTAEPPSNRGNREFVFGNGASQLNRVPKFHIRNSETYSMRIKNHEGRTYLSDVANVENNKCATESTWTKHSTDTSLKPTKSSSVLKSDSKTSVSKAKNAESGPRHCSLRLQAGSSNILLDNATSYAPVLYTSRHNGGNSDISSTVLVHIPRSRSASASSTDEVQHRSDISHAKSSLWAHSPTETEL